MRHFPTQIGANDDPIALHLAEVLGQHLFRRLRKQTAQVSEPRRAFLKSAENADFLFALKQPKCKSNSGLFLRRKLAAFRN